MPNGADLEKVHVISYFGNINFRTYFVYAF